MQFGKPMTIEEFIENVFDDPEDTKSLKEQIAASKLRTQMVALRCARGISQSEIEKRFGGWLSEDIEQLEYLSDAKLTISDVRAYAAALGVVFTIEVDGNGVVDVKFLDNN